MDDVKEYDPKYKAIQRKIDDGLDHISVNVLKLLVLLIFAFEIVKGLAAIIKNLIR